MNNNNNNNNRGEYMEDEEIGVNDYSGDLEYVKETACSSQPFLVKRTNTTSQIAIVGSKLYPIQSLDYE